MSLVPPIPGPKLSPFKGDSWPLTIDFLELLGKGLNGHVWKVRIEEQIYALKIFIHNEADEFWTEQWPDDTEAVYYFDAFYNECRAYGRLQEMRVTHVAAECYGYVILTANQEEELRRKGLPVLNSKQGQAGQPLKAIVKEFIDGKIPFTPKMVRGMIRNLHTIHEVGIFIGDMHKNQYLNGLLLDFGRSKTVPHSHLTPEWIDAELSSSCPDGVPQQDEEHFDQMIDKYNQFTKGSRIWRRINPNWDYKEDVLRKTRGDELYWHTLYSKYRPELFDWEKALDGKKRPKLKSLAGTSRLDFKECAARKARLLQLDKEKQ